LYTGRILSKDIYPSYHGIYQGHFFDKLHRVKCGSNQRFTIEKKIKEVVNTKATYKIEIIKSGTVISKGIYIKPPYKVVLKDYKITINEVLFKPSVENKDFKITGVTDENMITSWEYLVDHLKANRLIIYGGNRYEMTSSNYPTNTIDSINRIMKSTKVDKQKKEEIAKVLDTFADHVGIKDIVKNWK